MDDRLNFLLDRLAISDLMTRYATSVDNHDFDRLRTCFTADVVATGFGAPGPLDSRDRLLDFITTALGRFGATQHLMGNQVVLLNGDTATVTTDVQATHFVADRPGFVLTLWATYHDEVVRQDGEWKIRAHRLQPRGTQTLG